MYGKIINVHEYTIIIENLLKRVEASLIGVHVIFEDKHKIVAEISGMTCNEIECTMIGEIEGDNFITGLTHKPTGAAKIRTINKDEVILLVGSQNVDTKESVYLGKSLIYDGLNVSANINKLFSNHFAILGNTGSGKSCTVARLIQNLFYRREFLPFNSSFVLFDVYGEYHSAFEKINFQGDCRYKSLTTNVNAGLNEIIKIPPYFLEVDDLALLLQANDPIQIPIIQKALRYVYLFTEEEERVISYKNNIIAKAIMDILTSGKEPARIRDQVVAVLTSFNTKDINLESEIVQPGYVRTIRQCLRIDESGKINTIHLVIEYLERFINKDFELNNTMKPRRFDLKDLYNAFEFALISEGVLKSDKVYDVNNILKVRLDSIINSPNYKYFEYNEYITKEEYIRRLFTSEDGRKVQILNFNLNYVDERFTKVLTKLFSKLFFTYALSLPKSQNFSIQILLEEAHRYVQNDNDIDIIGYNVFDRITKEGRKYGVVLGLITQRPCELSTTSLSQCSNYIVLRMFHPDDLDIIRNITHSISGKDVEKIKALGPGIALCFGSALNLPLYVKIDPPNPFPTSSNAQIKDSWFK